MLDWNYSDTNKTLDNPQYQGFNATLRAQQYMSGGQHPWQGVFYVVLGAVFATNVFCLIYFAISGSHVTDFIEPQNLFALSLNSPPSAVLDGYCGGNLGKEQFNASWRIMHDKEREHLHSESRGVQKRAHKRSFWQQNNFEMKEGVMKSAIVKLGLKRSTSRP